MLHSDPLNNITFKSKKNRPIFVPVIKRIFVNLKEFLSDLFPLYFSLMLVQSFCSGNGLFRMLNFVIKSHFFMKCAFSFGFLLKKKR